VAEEVELGELLPLAGDPRQGGDEVPFADQRLETDLDAGVLRRQLVSAARANLSLPVR
jgi:hypothetical protein